MITLLVLQGPDKGRRFELPDRPALIGRESRALPLSDNTTSRRHAELLPEAEGWVLKDLGSSNGTYINGVRVTIPTRIRLGDQIRVGRSLLVFGAQPGVRRGTRSDVTLAGEEAGMDSAIINTLPSNDDSMVLAVPEPAAAAMGNLKTLYRLAAALGSSFDLHQVLEVVMDSVFETVQADRGIILLIEEKSGELLPQVVRQREEPRKPGTGGAAAGGGVAGGEPGAGAGTGTGETFHASRTIINHVLEKGEGVLSSNAMGDPRFKKGKSVHDMGIRSALCVPIKARNLEANAQPAPKPAPQPAPQSAKQAAAGAVPEAARRSDDETLGVIYIDSSVRNYTYSTDQLRLLTAIGLQAGMAVQNAKLYRQGLEAERLAAVGETTAALSHSIKNILQALRGGADVVEMGFRGNNVQQAKKGWTVVERNLDRIYGLTMNLLAYSRPREPDFTLVNPRKMIDDCLELIAPLAGEKGIMAVAEVDDDQPPIPMDEAGVHQVLMNLLGNAVDAISSVGERPGAEQAAATGSRPGGEQGLIRVTCRYDPATSRTQIDVIDNGPGILPAVQKKLFELFHSTKGNRGTGLGLAVARKIVREHDGDITVTSTPGEGATFTVSLPPHPSNYDDPSSTHGPRPG